MEGRDRRLTGHLCSPAPRHAFFYMYIFCKFLDFVTTVVLRTYM